MVLVPVGARLRARTGSTEPHFSRRSARIAPHCPIWPASGHAEASWFRPSGAHRKRPGCPQRAALAVSAEAIAWSLEVAARGRCRGARPASRASASRGRASSPARHRTKVRPRTRRGGRRPPWRSRPAELTNPNPLGSGLPPSALLCVRPPDPSRGRTGWATHASHDLGGSRPAGRAAALPPRRWSSSSRCRRPSAWACQCHRRRCRRCDQVSRRCVVSATRRSRYEQGGVFCSLSPRWQSLKGTRLCDPLP